METCEKSSKNRTSRNKKRGNIAKQTKHENKGLKHVPAMNTLTQT